MLKTRNLFLTVLLLLATASSFAQNRMGKISSPDGEANIREYPTTKARILYVLYNGDVVDYKNCNVKGWYLVYRDNHCIGYCSSSLIKPYGASSVTRTVPGKYRGTLYGYDGFVNVRKYATVKSAVVCSYPNGTVLLFSGSGSWVKAYDSRNNFLGYVSSSCIK